MKKNKIDTGEFKVLLLDIETTPHTAFVWEKWETNVIAFKDYGSLLCYSYKWLGEKETHVVGLNTMKPRALIHSLYCLFNEAEIIVAHNGDSFDIKMANQYFIKEGFSPPHNYKTIDTKKLAKEKFRFVSNKLDDLGDYLGLGRKIQTGGFDLWQGCMNGDRKAWKKMLEYNKQDVDLLEKIYMKLRPWCRHPNLNVKKGINKCPVCQSNRLHSRGLQINGLQRYKRYQCQDCGRWSRGEIDKTKITIK
jgi:uncharacterized protein YprB with RNaseH-like and TPR domain